MKHTIQLLLCLLTAVHLCGGHLGMMQMVAWAEMLHDYTQEKGLITGVVETFDGDHPCQKCCKIAVAEREEQKKNPLPQMKFDGVTKWFNVESTQEIPEPKWISVQLRISFIEPGISLFKRGIAPPTPPPRDLS